MKKTAAVIEYHYGCPVVGTIAPAIRENDEGILARSPLDKRRFSRPEMIKHGNVQHVTNGHEGDVKS